MKYPTTPDGRYFIHKQRLWRCTNPNLNEGTRQQLVAELMSARRDIRVSKQSGDASALSEARRRVHQAKISLGERGATWWDDDSDFNRHLVQNTPYAKWWQQVSIVSD